MTPPDQPTSPRRGFRRPALLLALVPITAIVLLGLAFGRTMAHTGERLAGSNSVKLQQPVVQSSGGQNVCQGVLLPRDAASALLFVAPTKPMGPPLTLTIVAGKQTVARSPIAGGWTGGVARFAFARVARTYPDSRLCVHNGGRDPIAFGGLPSAAPTSTTVAGVPQHGTVTIEFFREGTSSWWSLLPTIAHRAGVLKGSLAGAWSFWLAAGLIVLAGVAALLITAREARR
jgi:hypothetical protein